MLDEIEAGNRGAGPMFILLPLDFRFHFTMLRTMLDMTVNCGEQSIRKNNADWR